MNFSCVYSIQCKDKSITDLYIGSCKNYRKRYNRHKESYKNCNYKVYQFIRQNGGWDNWEMIVEVKTDDLCKEDRRILEQVYKDLLQPHLNSYNIIGDDEEKRKNTLKTQKNKTKGKCPNCGKKLIITSIKRHLRKSCKA